MHAVEMDSQATMPPGGEMMHKHLQAFAPPWVYFNRDLIFKDVEIFF